MEGTAENDRIRTLLLEAEQRNAEIPALKLQIEDLRHELRGTRAAAEAARERMLQVDRRLNETHSTMVSIMASSSWKLTRPLRVGKRAAKVAKRLIRS